MKLAPFSKTLYALQAGSGTTQATLQVSNCILKGVAISLYGSFTASSYGVATLTRNPATGYINWPQVLATMFIASPINGACDTTDSLWIPLDIEYKYPETLYLNVNSSAAAATIQCVCALHFLQK